jgi:hypothetical protein
MDADVFKSPGLHVTLVQAKPHPQAKVETIRGEEILFSHIHIKLKARFYQVCDASSTERFRSIWSDIS